MILWPVCVIMLGSLNSLVQICVYIVPYFSLNYSNINFLRKKVIFLHNHIIFDLRNVNIMFVCIFLLQVSSFKKVKFVYWFYILKKKMYSKLKAFRNIGLQEPDVILALNSKETWTQAPKNKLKGWWTNLVLNSFIKILKRLFPIFWLSIVISKLQKQK